MLMTALLPLASYGQEPLTVNDGTGSNGYIPLYGSYCDYGNFTQFIIPASDLAAMSGSTITKMVFYTTSYYSNISWGNAEFNCYLAEVDNTVFSSTSFVDWTSLTVVSTGSLSISDNQMEVNVDEFSYGGGNLLIGFAQTTAGTYKYVEWNGVAQSANTALYKYNSSSPFSATLPATGSSQQFLPKVTFTYTAGTPSACAKPGSLAVSNITASSATFNWSRGGSETSWVLEYTTADDTEWEWAESVAVNDTFKTIETLQEKTTYKARVYADCGSDGMSAARVLPGTFKTPCEAVTNLNEPFTDYEGTNYYTAGELPDCWETIYTGSSAGYAPHVYNVGTGYTDYAPHEGDNCLVINAGGSSYGSTNYVILPVIDNLSTMQVSFVTGMYCSSSWDDYGKLTLGYMTGSTSATFHAIEEIGSTSYTSPASHEYILAGYDIPDGARLAFKWYDNTSYAYGTISCFIDDVVVDLAPACKKPANLACASNTARTATLSWKPLSGESSWTLEYSTEADLSDAISVMADDTFKLITGLTPNTTYYARVKANCGDENSDFGNPISFKTAYGIPFVETFETSTFPADWSLYSGKAADAFDGTLPTSTTSGWTSTTYGLGTYNYKMNIDGSNRYWLVTPNIDLTGATSVELNFDLAITDWNSNNAPGEGEPAEDDEFMVIISTDNGATWSRSNATTWGTGADYDYEFASVSNTGTNYTISLDEYLGGTVKIAFYGATGSDDADFDVHVDNIYVQVPPTCYKPTNVTKDDVQARSAVIGWTDNNPGDEPTGNWLLVVNDTILVPADENPFLLTGLTPETRYTVNVQALCSGNDSSDVSTSSVTFTTLVSCPKPTNLTVVDTTVTSTSATFTWRPGRDEDTWFVRYGTGNTSTDTLVYDTVVTLTGLTPATTYMVKVRSFCDVADTSAWATASPLTTECEPYVVTNNIPFTENFNTLTSGIPTCWDNNEGTITSSYYKWGYYSSGNTGACVYFSASSITGTNMLKTPVMDLTQVTDPKLSFYYKKNGSYDFSVYVSTDGGETYTTPLAEGLATASSWTQKTIALENLDSYDQVVIVFKGTGSYSYYSSYYYYLDDVEVGGIPTCNKPIAVLVPDSSLTANSAIVHWVDTNATAPESYTVSYTDGENTYTVTSQDTTVTLPSLTANTDYTVKVMANCGTDGESAWTEEVSFSTPCELASAEGYAENFSGHSSVSTSTSAANGILPDCWDYIYTGTSTGYQPHLYISSYYSPTANDTCVIMTAGYSSYGAENFAVLPGFESLAGKQMVFATAMENASYGILTVGYVTSLTADAFTPMVTVPSNYYNGDNRYATHVVSLDTVPANARVAFRWAHDGSSYYYCCIDDIKIEDIPDCLPPTTVSVDTVTARTATLSWDNRNEEIPEGWTVEYTYNDTVTRTATCDTTFITLVNLVPETRYTVKVKANCSEISESAWSTPVNFTTTVTCFEPTNLTYSDVTDNSVILDWTTGRDGEEEWILVLNNEEILVDSHPLTIDTLRENTRYTVTVHALCTATDTSNASNTKTFTTACTPVSCEGYAENFNTGYAPTTSAISTTDNMPACWNYLVTNATGNYSRPHIYKGSSYSPTANDTCIIMPSNTTIGASYAIMLPLTDLNRKQIRFATAMSDAAGVFSLGYMTDIEDATTFTLIETVPTNLHNDATNRYAEHTFELVNIPDGARLAFKWEFNGSSTAKYACIDDIAIIDAPNCMKPTDLTVTNISAHEATFSWRENNTPDPENGWMLRISDGTTDVDTLVETTNFTFDQLASNTDYTVTVLTLCNVNDTSLWSVPATFSTPCEPLAANGYVENFNSYTGVSTTISDDNGYLPACWDYIFTGSSAGYKPHMYKGTYYSPTSNDNCIIMTAGNSTYGNANYAIMPEMDILTGKWMKFATAMDNANIGNLTVGYVTGLDASTFVMLDTIPNNNYNNTDTRYVLHEVFVNTVPAGARIAFKWAATTSYYYCCIDDIKIEDIPDCITPINVRVPEDSITGTTAKVYWTDRNTDEPASWTIMVNDTTVIANTNPFTLTDLTPSTLYTVKVRTNCNANDTSDWSDEVTFYTACGIRSAEGFSEDFTAYTASNYLSSSSGILPRCWDYIYTGDSYYSTYRPHIYNGSYSPTANNNCIVMTAGIYVYDDWYDYEEYDYGMSNYVVLPEFESLAGKQLVFATAMNSSTYGMLSVGYVTSLSASTFTALDTVPNNYYYNDNTRYALHEVNVSTVPAGARIAFRWTGTSDYYYYCTIDDIVIEDIPTCLKPINVEVIESTITQTSATIQWDDQNETVPANGWTISYNDTVVTVTTDTFTLTGLTASTVYTVKVKANCSATDDSRYSEEITFHTECGSIPAVGYSEDFSSYTGTSSYYSSSSVMPTCWDMIYTGTTSGYPPYVYNGTYTVNGNGLFVNAGSSTYGSTNYAIMPELTGLNGNTMTFKYRFESSSYGELVVGYLTDITNASTFQTLHTVDVSTTAVTDSVTFDNVPEGARIAFQWTASASYTYYGVTIDDINITATPEPCAAPDSVTIDSNYVVRWTGDAPGGYNVFVVVGNDTVVRAYSSTHLYTITSGLNDGDHAIVYVQSICASDDLSEWSTGVPFVYGTDTIGVDNYRISANIFPNPTTGNVTVESNAIGADLNVYDMFGKLMIATKVTDVRTELNLSGFAPGVYMVRIANSTAVTTVKVVKK